MQTPEQIQQDFEVVSAAYFKTFGHTFTACLLSTEQKRLAVTLMHQALFDKTMKRVVQIVTDKSLGATAEGVRP